MESVNEKIQLEKNSILNFMLLLFAFSGVPVILVSLFRAIDTGMNASLWVQALAGFLVVVVALLRNRLPYLPKVWFLVSLPLVLGIVGVFSFGLIDGSVMLLISAVIIAATLAGIRSGFMVVAFSSACLFGIFLMMHYGGHRFQVDETIYMYSLSSWLVYIMAFSVLALVTSILIGRISGVAYQNMKELQLQTKELIRANETKDKLFQLIAHDLRSPFQGLMSGLELFADEGDHFSREQKEKLLSAMLRDSTATFSMLENLLYWSKSQIGELELERKYLQVDALVDSCIAPFQRLAEQKQISVTKQVDIDSLVFADERSVRIILCNLLHNAIKFTKHEGRIHFHVSRHDGQTWIELKDDGVGFSEEQKLALFGSGKSASQRGTANERGTGLGLNVSMELARLNHGNLSVRNNDWGGASVILHLPASMP